MIVLITYYISTYIQAVLNLFPLLTCVQRLFIIPASSSFSVFDNEHELPMVYSNGMVLWIPKVMLNARCYVDMYNFPNDKHKCQLKFGSWTYHNGQVRSKSSFIFKPKAQRQDSFNSHSILFRLKSFGICKK